MISPLISDFLVVHTRSYNEHGCAILAGEEYFKRPGCYHRWRHLRHLWVELSRCLKVNRPGIEMPSWLVMALLYHDVIYVPTATNNEEKSAQRLIAEQPSLPLLEVAATAIRLSKHQHPDYVAWKSDNPLETELTEWFLDADLSILGASPARYQRYLDELRVEFSVVPASLYRMGRLAFVKEMYGRLESDTLFYSAYFSRLYADQAHENMRVEIESLQ